MNRRKASAVIQGAVLPAGALRAMQGEKSWQAEVEHIAVRLGWICWHDHDSRRNDAGFPDLLLIRDRVVWIECKAEGGRLSPAQKLFLEALDAAGEETYVFRPSQMDEVERVLS